MNEWLELFWVLREHTLRTQKRFEPLEYKHHHIYIISIQMLACSIGTLCHSAGILQRIGLRPAAFPFDWIFFDQEKVLHCVQDNFQTFLDKTQYISIGPKKCGHRFYNTRMFWHHNPLINQMDYDHYVRAVDRFKQLLTTTEHKLFVLTFVNMERIDENTKRSIMEFNTQFAKYTSNYVILCIFHFANRPAQKYSFDRIDNVHFLELHTLSESTGLAFTNEKDNMYLDVILRVNYLTTRALRSTKVQMLSA